MQPARHVSIDLDPPLEVLTATARGMIEHNFIRAAQRAHTELMAAVAGAGLLPEVRSRVGLFPDVPNPPNDAQCRYLAGVLFGHDLVARRGPCQRPAIALTGSLAWLRIAPGRHAVFMHVGPYDTMHLTWQAIYRDWLPASGEVLRHSPPMEVSVNSPDDVRPEDLRTEIWMPLA
jgi:AraC family transcriptional regulator